MPGKVQSEEKIVFVLRQVESGKKVAESITIDNGGEFAGRDMEILIHPFMRKPRRKARTPREFPRDSTPTDC